MTTSELIKELMNFPADTRVVVSGYEDGVDDATCVGQIRILANRNTEWYYGRHDVVKHGGEPAVHIGGRS